MGLIIIIMIMIISSDGMRNSKVEDVKKIQYCTIYVYLDQIIRHSSYMCADSTSPSKSNESNKSPRNAEISFYRS